MHRLICGFAAVLAVTPVTAAPVVLDRDRWQQLSSVSRAAFALPDVRYNDRHGATDRWDVAGPAGGDCEDKALFARAALIEKGWPSTSLRLALVWTEAREYHAVLTIDVVRDGEPATYIIDSRFAWVLGWDALSRFGYRWDRRQSAQGPGWIRIAQP
jgi:predicted transglutaminase-like cysteine proteinase